MSLADEKRQQQGKSEHCERSGSSDGFGCFTSEHYLNRNQLGRSIAKTKGAGEITMSNFPDLRKLLCVAIHDPLEMIEAIAFWNVCGNRPYASIYGCEAASPRL